MAKPPDRVQLLKQESAGGGGNPADNHLLFAEDKLDPRKDAPEGHGFYFQSPSGPDDEECYVTRDDSGNMLLKDENASSGAEVTLSNLLESAAGGITEVEHEGLDTLVHSINETSYAEVTRTAGRITNVTVWTNSSKTLKVRETSITRTAGRVTQMVSIQYDGVGDEVHRLTRDITRTAGVVTSIDATKA